MTSQVTSGTSQQNNKVVIGLLRRLGRATRSTTVRRRYVLHRGFCGPVDIVSSNGILNYQGHMSKDWSIHKIY